MERIGAGDQDHAQPAYDSAPGEGEQEYCPTCGDFIESCEEGRRGAFIGVKVSNLGKIILMFEKDKPCQSSS